MFTVMYGEGQPLEAIEMLSLRRKADVTGSCNSEDSASARDGQVLGTAALASLFTAAELLLRAELVELDTAIRALEPQDRYGRPLQKLFETLYEAQTCIKEAAVVSTSFWTLDEHIHTEYRRLRIWDRRIGSALEELAIPGDPGRWQLKAAGGAFYAAALRMYDLQRRRNQLMQQYLDEIEGWDEAALNVEITTRIYHREWCVRRFGVMLFTQPLVTIYDPFEPAAVFLNQILPVLRRVRSDKEHGNDTAQGVQQRINHIVLGVTSELELREKWAAMKEVYGEPLHNIIDRAFGRAIDDLREEL